MKLRTGYLLALLSFAIIFAIGCSRSLDQYGTLADHGPLPLSSSSGFLGANLFLSDEFSKSSNLFNFFKGRGAPNAISIESSNPLRMKLYYPIDKEFYISDLSNNEHNYQWVTRGPYRIDRHDYRDMISLFSSGVEEPAFQFQGKLFRFKPTRAEIAEMQEAALRAMATPTPLPKPKTKSSTLKTKLAEESKPTAIPVPTAFQPLTFDQQALAMSQGFAERATNGDVIHTVKKDTETIESIANWYTGNSSNCRELLKSSGIAEGVKLAPGMRIQIPKSLVKQFKAM